MHEDLPILQASNIHKSFENPLPTQILKGVELKVTKGESIAIMGRSGEGKSTLLNILGTLESSSFGQLTIGGLKVSAFNRSRIRNEHIGFVFQSFHLFYDLSVIENVLMPAKIARKSTKANSYSWNRAQSLIKEVGLEDRAHYQAKLLSGGEKQRTAIARALCNDPDIILADEPTGNLDKKTADSIHELMLNYSKKFQKTLIIVTHNQELASLCDRSLVLENGVLI